MSTITDKNKFISAYVDKISYSKFQNICKIQGLSANKVINMMIKEYIAKNAVLLSSGIDIGFLGQNFNE